MLDLNYTQAIAKADHLKALGQNRIWLRDDTDFPWDKVVSVREGNGYRLSGPTSMYVIAEDQGLTFELDVEFENRDANGRGVCLFDRDRLRDVSLRLPPTARLAFAEMLAEKVMPGLTKHTAEIRKALNEQLDSEDCVRGLIAFAIE